MYSQIPPPFLMSTVTVIHVHVTIDHFFTTPQCTFDADIILLLQLEQRAKYARDLADRLAAVLGGRHLGSNHQHAPLSIPPQHSHSHWRPPHSAVGWRARPSPAPASRAPQRRAPSSSSPPRPPSGLERPARLHGGGAGWRQRRHPVGEVGVGTNARRIFYFATIMIDNNGCGRELKAKQYKAYWDHKLKIVYHVILPPPPSLPPPLPPAMVNGVRRGVAKARGPRGPCVAAVRALRRRVRRRR